MYNKFELGPSVQKPKLEDIPLFGRFLQQARNILQKTVKQIALEIGVKNGTLSRWENGESLPGEDKLQIIAEKYGVRLDELTSTWLVSKKAREMEIEARKTTEISRNR